MEHNIDLNNISIMEFIWYTLDQHHGRDAQHGRDPLNQVERHGHGLINQTENHGQDIRTHIGYHGNDMLNILSTSAMAW